MVILTSSIVWFAIVFLSLPLGVSRPGLRLFPIDETDAVVLRRFIRQVLLLAAAAGLPHRVFITAGSAKACRG